MGFGNSYTCYTKSLRLVWTLTEHRSIGIRLITNQKLVDLEGIEPYPQLPCKGNRQPHCLSPILVEQPRIELGLKCCQHFVSTHLLPLYIYLELHPLDSSLLKTAVTLQVDRSKRILKTLISIPFREFYSQLIPLLGSYLLSKF